ncbi:MAG TPA: CNNM domain-containing protein [Nitrososphaerales archaeon]|nr:CNNM domain-containing protein [Nitrososphaerales archaeon]HUK75361.1 CNNM domain-containing protein [Nitrososphaerales archaeon]
MATWYVYLVLVVALVVSFVTALIEATFLTVRPLSLTAASSNGDQKAAKALRIVEEKTRLVSTTTLLSTFADTILATASGLILSSEVGPEGWVLAVVLVSLVIMIFLNLLPKAIGIENSVRMATSLASGTRVLLTLLAPVAVPLTKLARGLSQGIVGKPAYANDALVDEFESLLILLEQAGHIEPDSGRILRSALASSKTTAGDLLTPIHEIVSVGAGADVRDALRIMGSSNHPHLPVYDAQKNEYVGAVTFRSLFGAMSADGISHRVVSHMVQPAKVDADETAAKVMDKMQRAGVTIAFVYEGGRLVGMVTVTDILEVLLGTKIRREGRQEPPASRGASRTD